MDYGVAPRTLDEAKKRNRSGTTIIAAAVAAESGGTRGKPQNCKGNMEGIYIHDFK
jgi:hypothetical protein